MSTYEQKIELKTKEIEELSGEIKEINKKIKEKYRLIEENPNDEVLRKDRDSLQEYLKSLQEDRRSLQEDRRFVQDALNKVEGTFYYNRIQNDMPKLNQESESILKFRLYFRSFKISRSKIERFTIHKIPT